MKELTQRRKCRNKGFIFTLSREGKGRVWRHAPAPAPAPAPALRGWGCEFLWGNGVVVEQDVSVRLQLVSVVFLGAGSGGGCDLVSPVS